jgi:adenosylhomocysteine nucleosidase
MWQHLLKAWLGGLAREKVREKVVEAAQQRFTEAQQAAAAPCGAAPAVCDAGVVFALGAESGGLEDLLQGSATTRGEGFVVRCGRLHQREVAIVLSGTGRSKAAHAAEALISGHRPRLVISAGFAGGLTAELRRNDLVLGECVKHVGGAELPLDAARIPAPLRAWPRVFSGRLLTADRVVRTPAEKKALGQEHQALAVEMETIAVAEVCRERNVPLAAVRVIIDAADDTLPPDVERLLRQKTTAARLGAALGVMLNRPGSVKDLYGLKENSLACSDRLAKFLAELVRMSDVGCRM